MSQTRSWRPLPLGSSPDFPVLLVSFHTDTSAYTIHVTDMANMWSETLDRKAIFMRGWNENTSIDPSDTPDNMAKFLSCLNTALDASHPGHNEASIRLGRDSRSDAGDHDLVLNINYEIPGLQPLKWPMYLKKLPPSSIATHLVLPLIQAHHAKDLEIEFLTRSLGNKDAVINKLLDKLEAVGTGMEHVFNALSGKKKISRAAAAEKVPGLAPFDHRRWKSGLAYEENCPNDAESLVQCVFEKGGLQFEPITDSVESPRLDQWWQDFKDASSVAHPPQYKAAAAKDKSPTPQDSEKARIEEDDDDFQVQSTPPRLVAQGKSTTHAKETPVADDASTEGESLASAGSVSPGTGTRKADKPVRRLGALGGKKQSTPPLSPSPVKSQAQKKPLSQQRDDSETASESEDDDKPATVEVEDLASSSSSPPRPAANRSGLGRIGGNKPKRPVEEKQVALDPEAAEPSTTAVSHRHPKKLGVIGKHKDNKDEVTKTTDEDNRGGRAGTKEAMAESRRRETSQERADRRREELKKELEKKAAAGPAKKKRRF
ncbi:XRCC4-like factor-domain-containing protein [Fusarium redolens]|uniref:Non-homologous end-joining factor 1 n=1 Tax=Fusarium redolens TaxID=48865 RepID=A0A9P9R853_FUSRE|nr:XRCC4-like factor-domain-containing protein [Fusarium redolens]KAH7269347.1 XRCC4-like factor-domain-containing protein [Fusarium redolens]